MSLIVAFFAGLLTFFTPCVFPLIPSYISYITGFSVEELAKKNNELLMRRSALGAAYFIAGFSVIFIMLGVAASFAGSFIVDFQNYLRLAGGVLILLLGLMMMGAFNIKFLEKDKRINLKKRPLGYIGAFVFGMTFAAGWVPCVGPILSSILIIASTSGSRFYGGILLFCYCLGLGLPMFISAVAFNWFLSAYKNVAKYLNVISVISGAMLVVIGLLLITDNITLITQYINHLLKGKGI